MIELKLAMEAKPEFSQKKGVHHIMWLIFTMFHAQNKKNSMIHFREIVKNSQFCPILTSPLPGEAKPDFFSKIGPCHFSSHAII